MSQQSPYTINRRAVRQSFDRAAPQYDASAFLQREIADRLLSHFEFIRPKPRKILDAGCGTGYSLPKLQALFPEAAILGLDLAPAMLQQTRTRVNISTTFTQKIRRFLGTSATPFPLLCGDCSQLPLADQCLDFLFSNLTIQWIDAYPALFQEWHRVLAADGLVLFSTFGPDTLSELRQAFRQVDHATHVSQFIDLHDLGDALVAAGFADPVMEMEKITVHYRELRTLLLDLKGIGAHNLTAGRPRGLMGKNSWSVLLKAYEKFRQPEGLPATYEVIYGHAWKPKPQQTSGYSPISLEQLKATVKK